MLCRLYCENRIIEVPPIDNKVRVLKNVEVVENGCLVRKNVYQDVSITDNFKDVNMFDFTIENLTATGNLSKLNSVSMQNNDFVSVSDGIAQIDEMLSKTSE